MKRKQLDLRISVSFPISPVMTSNVEIPLRYAAYRSKWNIHVIHGSLAAESLSLGAIIDYPCRKYNKPTKSMSLGLLRRQIVRSLGTIETKPRRGTTLGLHPGCCCVRSMCAVKECQLVVAFARRIRMRVVISLLPCRSSPVICLHPQESRSPFCFCRLR